jgi:hypothetical protein
MNSEHQGANDFVCKILSASDARGFLISAPGASCGEREGGGKEQVLFVEHTHPFAFWRPDDIFK